MSQHYFQDGSYEVISKILNTKKIKYERLNELFLPILDPQGKQGSYMNIYIDIDSFIKQLYQGDIVKLFTTINNLDRLIIASELLNTIGHYRHYFASRHGMYTRFVFFNSLHEPTHLTKLDREYKAKYFSNRNLTDDPTINPIHSIIGYNLKVMKSIIDYIPNAYYIYTKNLESSAIPRYFIDTYGSPYDTHLILSNDVDFLQDVVSNTQTMLLEVRGSEKSKLVTRDGALDYLLKKAKSKKSELDYMGVTVSHIPILQGLVGSKNKGVPAIKRKGYPTAMAMLDKYKHDIDFFEKDNLTYVKESLPEILKLAEEDATRFRLNIDLLNHQKIVNENHVAYKTLVEASLRDLVNAAELRKVNENVFVRHPLIFDYIFEGQAYGN